MENQEIAVLLVDDNATVLWGLGKLIEGDAPRLRLLGKARGRREALLLAGDHPDVIVLDLDLDGYSSLDMLPELLRLSGGAVLIHTGLADPRLHAAALRGGAKGVVKKGEPAEVILQAIKCVHGGRIWNSATSALPGRDGKGNCHSPWSPLSQETRAC